MSQVTGVYLFKPFRNPEKANKICLHRQIHIQGEKQEKLQ